MTDISVVVTTFNDAEFIEQFLDEITKKQSRKPQEVIAVDGGSNDKTVEMLENYAKDSAVPVNVVNTEEHLNISEGINEGIRRSKSDWVLIMGVGNCYNSKFIEMLIKRHKECSAKVIYSSVIGTEKTVFAHVFNQYFLKGNRPQDLGASNRGVLVHKSVFDRAGYFWEGFIYAGEDTEYFCRVRRNCIECSCVVEASVYWDTPHTFKEYLKKMKVNSIADWQMREKNFICKSVCLQIVALIVYVALAVISPWCLLLSIPALIVLGVKKKTSNVLALLLGVISRYVMSYYYIQNRKYAKLEYHVPDELRM